METLFKRGAFQSWRESGQLVDSEFKSATSCVIETRFFTAIVPTSGLVRDANLVSRDVVEAASHVE